VKNDEQGRGRLRLEALQQGQQSRQSSPAAADADQVSLAHALRSRAMSCATRPSIAAGDTGLARNAR
jgi:hypothetical protein